ncbi:wings apart-like protein regulation of heterochromatin-domain-containing protein [Paraphysoderma sedebokerense]|nr:wings apart-like protein regulation of heterochromatin-domain-containing protein [Paraphysoderma sedebokerense]
MLSHSVYAMEGTKSTQGSQRQVRTTYSRKKNKKPVIELDISNDVDDDDNFISSLTGGHRGRKREETELSKQTLKRNEESNIDPYSFEFERHTPSKLQKEIRLGSEIKLNKNDNKNSSGKGRTKMTDDAHDLSRAKPKQMRLNPKTISKTREDEAVDPYSFEFEAISPSKLQAELRGLSGTPDTPKLTAKHRSIEHTTKSSHSAESSAKSLVSPCKQSTSTRLAAKVPDTQTKTFNTTPSKKLDKTNQQSHSPARKKTPPKRRISETSNDPFNFSFESQLINKKQKRRVDSISRDKSSPLSDPFHWEDNPSRPVSHSKKPLEVRKGGVVLGVTRSKSFSESQTSEDFPGSSQNSNDGWDLDDDDDDSANVKTMHELRHAGENKRFTDEMNYLIDGLGRSQKINVRRSSSIDLIRKLLQKDIRRKIRIHNMITPVIANLKGEPDLILQSSHLVILLFILSDADNHTVSDLICECSCVEMLLNSLLLPVKKDPFQHDKLFASGSKGKAEKMMISDLKDILNASELHELCHVSFPSLAHNCLTYLVSNLSASSSDNSVAHSKFEIAFQSCNGYDAYMTFMRSADALRVVESQDDVLPVELGEWQKYLKRVLQN